MYNIEKQQIEEERLSTLRLYGLLEYLLLEFKLLLTIIFEFENNEEALHKFLDLNLEEDPSFLTNCENSLVQIKNYLVKTLSYIENNDNLKSQKNNFESVVFMFDNHFLKKISLIFSILKLKDRKNFFDSANESLDVIKNNYDYMYLMDLLLNCFKDLAYIRYNSRLLD